MAIRSKLETLIADPSLRRRSEAATHARLKI
jgi:hypothetical protein